jgi:hypothetical protein
LWGSTREVGDDSTSPRHQNDQKSTTHNGLLDEMVAAGWQQAGRPGQFKVETPRNSLQNFKKLKTPEQFLFYILLILKCIIIQKDKESCCNARLYWMGSIALVG